MTRIGKKIKISHQEHMDNSPFYQVCARAKEGKCDGRITREHAIYFKGKQVNEPWAIVPLCIYHHKLEKYQGDGDLQKEINRWIAYSRATVQDLCDLTGEPLSYIGNKLSKVYPLVMERGRMEIKYGVYDEKAAIAAYLMRPSKVEGGLKVGPSPWYKIKDEHRQSLLKLAELYKEKIGISYSIREIIDRAIDDFIFESHAEIIRQERENEMSTLRKTKG